MIRNWLEEMHVLIKENGSKLHFSYEGNCFEIEREAVEKADIHQSISLFETILQEIKLSDSNAEISKT